MKILVNEEDKKYIEDALESGEVLQEDLRRWFKEKWVDVSRKVKGKHPPCGRKKAKDGSYPKCRPSKKVSKETPKVASSFDKKEKKAMTNQKRRAEKTHNKSGKGNSPKMTHYNEGQIIRLANLVLEEINKPEISMSDLESLKKVHQTIDLQEVMEYFDINEIDYTNLTESEMYIKFIEKNLEEEEYESGTYGVIQETNFIADDLLNEAEYQGRKVQLGKIMQGDIKKFKVYVKNDKGRVVKVNFGFGGKSAHGKVMKIKKNNPKRRKSFRARHNCANPGPRWKARYWACRTW